jgi:TolA-binding protein
MEKHERSKLRADTFEADGSASESFATAARMSAEEVIRMRNELKAAEADYRCKLDTLEQKINQLEKRIEDLENENQRTRAERDTYKEGATQLCYQVKSMKVVPVFDPTAK